MKKVEKKFKYQNKKIKTKIINNFLISNSIPFYLYKLQKIISYY